MHGAHNCGSISQLVRAHPCLQILPPPYIYLLDKNLSDRNRHSFFEESYFFFKSLRQAEKPSGQVYVGPRNLGRGSTTSRGTLVASGEPSSVYDVPRNHQGRSTTAEKPWSKVYDVEEPWSLRDRSTSGLGTLVASRAASEVPWWVYVGSTNIGRFRGRSGNLKSSRHPSPSSSTKASESPRYPLYILIGQKLK